MAPFFRCAGWLLVSAAVSTVAVAVDRPTVVVTQGKEQSYRIAVQRFAGGPEAEAYRVALGDALEYSGIFKMIDPKAFLGPTTTGSLGVRSNVNCSEWATIGGDVFVEGALRVEGAEFVAEFRVWELAACQRKLRRRYRQSSASDPSILAKRMADLVPGA